MSKIDSIFLGQERKHGAGGGRGRGQLLSPPTLSMFMDVVRLGLFDNINIIWTVNILESFLRKVTIY